MSLVTRNATTNQSNFIIRRAIPSASPNREPPRATGHILKDDMGSVSADIKAGAVLGHTIVISPSGANQTYTLPTATSLLNAYGKSIDTGVCKTATGNMIKLDIINRGTFPAYIASNTTGGDGSAMVCYPGGSTQSFTGSVTPIGNLTNIYLEWRSVNSGVAGATGVYSVYGNVGAPAIPSAGGLVSFGSFYGLTAGTDNGGATEYAATFAANVPVNFAHSSATFGGVAINNPGTATVQTNNTKFVLANIGTYKVSFNVHTTEPGQLQADIGDGTTQVIVPGSCGVNMNPTSGGHPISQTFMVTTTVANRILRIINPAGNSPALTVTPADGASTHANTPTLTIEQVA